MIYIVWFTNFQGVDEFIDSFATREAAEDFLASHSPGDRYSLRIEARALRG